MREGCESSEVEEGRSCGGEWVVDWSDRDDEKDDEEENEEVEEDTEDRGSGTLSSGGRIG